MGSLHPSEVSRRRISLSGRWILGVGICSRGFSCRSWYLVADAKLAKESTWLFSDLRNSFKVATGNLAFRLRTRCKYASIRSSLAAYFPLTLADHQCQFVADLETSDSEGCRHILSPLMQLRTRPHCSWQGYRLWKTVRWWTARGRWEWPRRLLPSVWGPVDVENPPLTSHFVSELPRWTQQWSLPRSVP